MSKHKEYFEGSDNVFADLGHPEPELALLKAQLARAILRALRDRGLTQTQAAELAGVTQADISHITRGYLDGYSVERLIRVLTALEHDVEITLRPKRGEKGRVSVVALEPAA